MIISLYLLYARLRICSWINAMHLQINTFEVIKSYHLLKTSSISESPVGLPNIPQKAPVNSQRYSFTNSAAVLLQWCSRVRLCL